MSKQNNTILQKVIRFIKYHNAFTIGLVLVFVFAGTIFASETVRDNVIGEKIVERSGVDNTGLLSADLDNFDFSMQIIDVSEDEQKYYVSYRYQTFMAKDGVWQKVDKGGTLKVSKEVLKGQDLGFYVSEELGEVLDSQLVYLKEVQEKEQARGVTLVQEKTKYTALIGLVLNPKTKELPGYEPVIKPPEPPEPVVVAYIEPKYSFSEPDGVSEESPEQSESDSEESDSEEVSITIYDQQAGQSYCLKLINGIMSPTPGVCATTSAPVDGEGLVAGTSTVGVNTTGSASTTITSYPEPEGESVVAVFTFVSPGESVTFQCKLDGSEFADCQSPSTYSSLTREQHIFNVRSVTEEGIEEEVPASFVWTITEPVVEGPETEATSTEPISEPKPGPEIPAEPETATTTDEIATTTEPVSETEATSTEPVIEPEPGISTSTDSEIPTEPEPEPQVEEEATPEPEIPTEPEPEAPPVEPEPEPEPEQPTEPPAEEPSAE